MSISPNSPDPMASKASIIITMKEQSKDLFSAWYLKRLCRVMQLMYMETSKDAQI